MDKREKKINDAKAEKEEAERAAAECQAQELAKQEEAQNRSREEIKAEAEKVRLEEKHLLEDAKRAHIETVEAHRAKTDAAFADDMKRADAPLEALAERFLSRLNAN